MLLGAVSNNVRMGHVSIRVISILLLASLPLLAPAAAGEVILPRLKPSLNATPAAAQTGSETPDSATLKPIAIAFPSGNGDWPSTRVAKAQADCKRLLAGLDIQFEPLAPIGKEGGCGTPGAIMISSIAGVAIEPPAEANCAFAEALHHWVAWSAKPAAMEHLKKKLTAVRNASAYACRRRNNSASGKMSQHAFVNALDISTLGFEDGSSTTIKGDWSGLKQLINNGGKSSFLARIRRDACIRFTTVLGPGSDPYHGDHFHIDLARRKGGYRICQ